MRPQAPPPNFTAPETEEIASLLPGYEILSLIAVGGMGAVYHARQKSLDREVAIKILPKQMSADSEFRASFEREAKSMAKFNHPNLIGIYDFGERAGYLFIIMELVHGKSLYYSAYGKTIDPDEAARLMIGVCEGLEAAHDNGILHRDIKPANILLDSDASPKIGDFGISRAAGDFESDSCYGTPGYTAPEVMHNVHAIDESTDIFAVGAMLYELLTGHVPEDPRAPASALVGCDPRFDRIIAKATHADPAQRYRKAAEMAADLQQIRDARVRTGPVLVAPAATGPVAPRRHAAPVMPVVQKPSTTGRNVAIIVFLLAAVFVAWQGYKRAKAGNDEKQAKADVEKAEALAKQQAERDKRIQARKAARQHVPTDTKKKIRPVIVKESPRESLERLRSRLVQGSRIKLPVGTRKRGDRARFFVEEPMTWHQAQQFCEDHGGHLPVFPDPAALARFSNKLDPDLRVWLGAGTNGSGWSWIDGTPWNQEIRRTSKSAYVTTDETGVLSPRPASEKCAFYIEWNMDGSNPGSLEAQMTRTTEDGGSNEFPAGTVRHDGRHYLLVARGMGWNKARKLAAAAGGTLAVPSDKIENEWLLEMIQTSLPGGKVCWLGGHREAGKLWQWLGGEPWNYATWGQNQPDVHTSEAAALAGTTGQSWQDLDPSDTADAFLIEWDPGAPKNKPATSGQTVSSGVEQKRAVCVRMLAELETKYGKLYKNNIRSYEREIDAYSRRLPRRERGNMAAAVMMMTQGYTNNMIPANKTTDGLSQTLVNILEKALDRQKRIQVKHLAEVESLRVKYCASLRKNIKQLKDKGLAQIQRKTEAEISASGADAQTFIHHITGKPYAGGEVAGASGASPKSDRSGWTATASSAEGVEGVEHVLDGDPNTIWHSVWNTSAANHLPHTLDISFGKKLAFSGLVLTPRRPNPQNGFNGVIKGYEIYIKSNSGSWRKIHFGELPRSNETQYVRFGKVVSATAVRIRSVSSHSGIWTSLAEFDLLR